MGAATISHQRLIDFASAVYGAACLSESDAGISAGVGEIQKSSRRGAP